MSVRDGECTDREGEHRERGPSMTNQPCTFWHANVPVPCQTSSILLFYHNSISVHQISKRERERERERGEKEKEPEREVREKG